MMTVHVETRIISVLGILDESGNVTQQFVLQADQNRSQDPLLIRKLCPEAFSAACAAIILTKTELEKKVAIEAAQPAEPVAQPVVEGPKVQA